MITNAYCADTDKLKTSSEVETIENITKRRKNSCTKHPSGIPLHPDSKRFSTTSLEENSDLSPATTPCSPLTSRASLQKN